MPESTDRGALTEAVYYILLSLVSPLHGYGIMHRVTEITNGRVNLGPGTLYGAINTLLEKRWIELVSEGRKKEYLLTKLGEDVLHDEISRLEELISNGKNVLEEVYEKSN